MILSPHFTLSEAVFSSTAARRGIDNTPTAAQVDAMKIAAAGMERVRLLLGGLPIHIDSWFRCPALNAAVGGAVFSAHLSGYAVDFVCRPHEPVGIVQAITISDIKFDQCIAEGRWVHLSFAPTLRREVLTAHFGPNGTTYTRGA